MDNITSIQQTIFNLRREIITIENTIRFNKYRKVNTHDLERSLIYNLDKLHMLQGRLEQYKLVQEQTLRHIAISAILVVVAVFAMAMVLVWN